MRYLVLIILAIIVWFVFKALSKKSASTPADPAALDQPDSGAAAATGQASEEASAPAAAAAGTAAIAAAATAAAGGKPDHAASTADNSSLLPSTGSVASDIAEMFKVLNLRASDAPRLSLSAEQYESLKGGDTGGLSGDILDGVLQKLKAML